MSAYIRLNKLKPENRRKSWCLTTFKAKQIVEFFYVVSVANVLKKHFICGFPNWNGLLLHSSSLVSIAHSINGNELMQCRFAEVFGSMNMHTAHIQVYFGQKWVWFVKFSIIFQKKTFFRCRTEKEDHSTNSANWERISGHIENGKTLQLNFKLIYREFWCEMRI